MKVLLIGYGSIGQRHFDLMNQKASVTCVDIISRFGKNENIKFQNIKQLSDKKINSYDVFFVCSETGKHESQLRFIDSKVVNKLILIEKPLSVTSMKYEPSNFVRVTYNLRFHPVIQKLKTLLENEHLISFSVRAGQYLPTWRPGQDYLKSYSSYLNRGGGVLRDLSHELDYAQYLCGPLEVISAIASSASHLNIQADDICTILAKNETDSHIQIQMDYLSYRPKREIEIQTDSYTISACLINNIIKIYDASGLIETVNCGEIDRNFTYLSMYADVFNNEGKKLTSFNEANDVMHLIDEITDTFMVKKW